MEESKGDRANSKMKLRGAQPKESRSEILSGHDSSASSGTRFSGRERINSIEVEGRTPAEAIQKALRALGAAREEVKIEILSEEEKGLFGMAGAHQAKVRVALLKTKKA